MDQFHQDLKRLLGDKDERVVRRVSEHLGVSITTVKRWVAGTITPHPFMHPSTLRVVRMIVDDF